MDWLGDRSYHSAGKPMQQHFERFFPWPPRLLAIFGVDFWLSGIGGVVLCCWGKACYGDP